MITKKVQKRELVEEAPVKHGKDTGVVEVDTSLSALNQEYQRLIEKLQISTQKRIEKSQAVNQKRIVKRFVAMASVKKRRSCNNRKTSKKSWL